MSLLKLINRAAAWPLIILIAIYQKTLSPDHGPLKFVLGGACRYHPTCSEYGKQSLQKYGLLGLPKLSWRILRCNPWSHGGYDPVEKEK